MIYQIKTIDGESCLIALEANGVQRFIPQDEANTDYQEYLVWVAEGNTAEVIEG